MKTQLSLKDLAAQITQRSERKEDFLATTPQMEVKDGTTLVLDDREFQLSNIAHEQIAAHTDIPVRYYRRMQEQAPDLLGANIREWFDKHPARRMVRTLDGQGRAFLSDRYARMDDDAFANTVLPVVMDIPGAEVVSCGITEEKTHIKFVSKRLQRDVKVNDPVQFGIAFSNSEVGRGRLVGSLLTYRLVCLNGMVVADESWGAQHTGRQHGKGRDLHEVFQLDTIAADGKATLLKLRDFARELLSEQNIDRITAKMQGLTEIQIEKPAEAVQKLAKAHSMTDAESNSVLEHLIKGGDLSMWGLSNAVTAAAQDEALDYTRATEFETIGGRMLDLSRTEYRELAKAA